LGLDFVGTSESVAVAYDPEEVQSVRWVKVSELLDFVVQSQGLFSEETYNDIIDAYSRFIKLNS
jgi:isopentenyldiphosphate isomerase